MRKVRAKDFGLRCVSNFDFAKPFNYPFIEGFVKTALREFAIYGIGPNNFSRTQSDGLFGYTVSFTLFAGNATFSLNRDGLVVSLSNGQTQQDVTLISELLDKAHKCIPNSEPLSHAMMAFCHAEFAEAGNADVVFKELVHLNGSVTPISLSALSTAAIDLSLPLKQRLRLDIAPSEAFENRLFMAWHFFHTGPLTEKFWSSLRPRIDEISRSLGLEVVS